jgi:hypothetical protein
MIDSYDERLKTMKLDLKAYGDEIIQHISSLHSDLASTSITLKNDPKYIVQLLQQDVLTLVTESQLRTKFQQENQGELEECQKLLDVLVQVSVASEMIVQCEESISGNDLIESCNLLSSLKATISKLPSVNTEIGSGKICQLLRRESLILQNRFQTRLKRLLRNCIHIEIGKVNVTKKLKGVVRDEEFVFQEVTVMKYC